MSKPVKQMLVRDFESRFEGQDNALLISVRGVSSNDTNAIRQSLAKQDIRVTVIRNNLARKAFEGTGLEALAALLQGPNALVYGAETVVDVARAIVDLAKAYPDVELKGAVLDGMVFEGDEGVKRLSKFPTRDEAIAEAVTLVLSPGRNLMGAVKGPGGRLASIIKSVEEKLEKNEAISRVG
jgi:large subunit ribosomal protein L10